MLAPHKIKFEFAKITRNIDVDWAIDAGVTVDDNTPELEKKKVLRRGDYKTLNLYIQKGIKGGTAIGVNKPCYELNCADF